jgi:hypothetical protein
MNINPSSTTRPPAHIFPKNPPPSYVFPPFMILHLCHSLLLITTPNVLIPITPPLTSPSSSYSSKPPVTQTYICCSRSIVTTSPDADTCTNNIESPVVFNQGYCLRDRGNIEPPDHYGFPQAATVIVEPSSYH